MDLDDCFTVHCPDLMVGFFLFKLANFSQKFLSSRCEIFIDEYSMRALVRSVIFSSLNFLQRIPKYIGSVNSNRAHAPPGISQAFVIFQKQKCCKCPWWGQHIYTNPHGGMVLRKRANTRPMGQDQNVIWWLKQKIFSYFSVVFLMVFEALILFLVTTATHFKISFKTWGFNSFTFCFL